MTTTEERLKQEAQEVRETFPRKNEKIRDITADFLAASNHLEPGQLVKDDWFSLFEAVGALEIMDPKMDSGYIPLNDTVEPEFDPAGPLLPEEILWILDQLLCLEIMWHEGYPLSQTVFTSVHVYCLLGLKQSRVPSLYLSKPDRYMETLSDIQQLGHDVLTAYCVAMIKCCELAVAKVQGQNFYEEEDFVAHCYGRELLTALSAHEAELMLDAAATRLQHTAGLGMDVRNAMSLRLHLRRDIIRALVNEDSKNDWEMILGAFDDIKKTHALATPRPDAFSEKIQRQLASSTPPRPMVSTDWDLSCEKWIRLCSEVLSAYRLTSVDIHQSPAALHRAVWAFSNCSRSKGGAEPFTLARTIMQDLLFRGGAVRNQLPHYDLLLSDIRELVLAGDPLTDLASFDIEVPTDPRHVCSRLMESFIEKCGEEYLNLYRMVCQNRCRIRRTFTQSISIFDALETEAKMVDASLAKAAAYLTVTDPRSRTTLTFAPLSSWTHFQSLRLISWTIQLGFETEIYLPDELAGMYWFLSYMQKEQIDLVEHILLFTLDRVRRARDQNTLADCLLAEEYLRSVKAWAEAARLIATALCNVYTLFISLGLIATPKRDFASRELLHEARMKPYLGITNTRVPSSDELAAATTQTKAPPETLDEIDELIKQAEVILAGLKKLIPEQGRFYGTEDEWQRDVKGMKASCVAIVVGCSQVKRAMGKVGDDGRLLAERVEVKVEKRFAEWWVVPVVKER